MRSCIFPHVWKPLFVNQETVNRSGKIHTKAIISLLREFTCSFWLAIPHRARSFENMTLIDDPAIFSRSVYLQCDNVKNNYCYMERECNIFLNNDTSPSSQPASAICHFNKMEKMNSNNNKIIIIIMIIVIFYLLYLPAILDILRVKLFILFRLLILFLITSIWTTYFILVTYFV